MTLSMWMMADWLKDYKPEVHIEKGERSITYTRFLTDLEMPDPKALYIQMVEGEKGICCLHQEDSIFLPDIELQEVLNRILEAFSFYQDWENRLNNLIKEQCSLEELLYASEYILTEPIFILDSSHLPIAQSKSYGVHDVDAEWSYMLETGTTRISDVIMMNDLHSHIYDYKDVYHFTDASFPNTVYQKNFFLDKHWIALANLIELHGPASRSMLDCFTIFCDYVQLWFSLNSEQQISQLLETMLRETFIGTKECSEKITTQFQQFGWGIHSQKQLFILQGINRTYNLNEHFCKVIQKTYDHHYAFTFNDVICDIFEIKKWENEKEDYIRLLVRGKYYVCQSQTFSDFTDLKNRYDQTVVINKVCPGEVGKIYPFDKYIFPYTLHMMKENVHADIVHPFVRQLLEYDQAHHTELAQTLYAYLLMERSMVKTAQTLQIHKSTLVYRLKRITELGTYDFDNHDVRIHILLSFRYFY